MAPPRALPLSDYCSFYGRFSIFCQANQLFPRHDAPAKTDIGKEAKDPSPNRPPQSACSATAVAFSEVLTPLGVPYVAVELICTSTKQPTLQPNSPYQIAGEVIAGDTNGCPVFHYQPSDVFVTHLCGSALLTSPTQVSMALFPLLWTTSFVPIILKPSTASDFLLVLAATSKVMF
ncbi:hypothetical protein PCASD_19475 [Puccinia coronata f. sp. avenae]|uniref:Uncharacterized protein n=1 Tax=Puccinia coronata f. sp. avenae TaxID=200324 RepID=A0A2N5UAD5_9BASI|nr:hypothetical protein PCASD_19475 [Puccinia coronata f. sp. avenae]